MKKIMATALIIVLLIGFGPFGGPTYGETISAGSRAELVDKITEQIKNHSESFSIHYRGAQDLVQDNVLTTITQFDGGESNTMLQSVYGLEDISGQLRYRTGYDIQYTFAATYSYSKSEAAKLDGELKSWVDNNLSPDMYPAAKTAIISRYLSDRLLYQLDVSRNNAYDGYYSMSTACSGYAELAYQLLNKAGLQNKMIAGYTPDGLSDTEFLAKRITSADMIALAGKDTAAQLQTLHVWNMVWIGNRWYHLDTTWVDGDRNGQPENGEFYPEYFLGSDADFGRSHAWIRGEYPLATANWWNDNPGELQNFIKAYLNTKVYDYPLVTSLKQLNDFTEDAYKTGRGSQTFRITQGVQPYDAFPALGSALSKVHYARSNYRETPKFPGDGYLLTLEFNGRDPALKEAVPAVVPSMKVSRGDSINVSELVKNTGDQGVSNVKWISLSPALITASGDGFSAVKEGRGFIGAYTRDEAVIIPVVIEIPALQVYLNDSLLALSPNPIVVNGRTLVPLRGIFEAMGATVVYDAENKTITGTRGGDTLFLTIGSRNALVNGKEILLDVPPQILGDRTFVPARLIAESFGSTVEWDGIRNRVMITDSDQ